MEHCAYCGESIRNDGLYVDEEVFCSEECMRDFGAGGDYDDEDDEDLDEEEDDDDDDDDLDEDDDGDDDDY